MGDVLALLSFGFVIDGAARSLRILTSKAVFNHIRCTQH